MTTGVAGRWLDEVEELARAALAPAVFRYVAEGARDEITLREAPEAWRRYRLLPRVLRDVRDVDTSTSLLGAEVDLPLGISPMTLQRAADPDGEVAMAGAAAHAGVPLVLSSNAGSTFADVAATGVTWWLQLYVAPDRSESEALVRAAAEAGASAVVLTVDTPVLGTRYPGVHGSVWDEVDPQWVGANAATIGARPEGREKARDLGPRDIAWLGETSGLPVVVKGVLRGDDAARCADAGASAVWVSNHGGRQLDRAVATAHCVAPVREAVGAALEVYVDGGVRSGLDVLVALSLGADAVFLGRPAFHALAAGGRDGVVRALQELGAELVEAMRLSGCAAVAEAAGIAAPDGASGPADGR